MPRDSALRHFVHAIIASDSSNALSLLAASRALATARFQVGATRQNAKSFFLAPVSRYIYTRDTALHFAAAAYRADLIGALLQHGADLHAANRLGDQPIHSAAVGSPGSPAWNPAAQSATIRDLIDAGANPNATNKLGVTPLHRAVRTRCAAAVCTLLECGADPTRKNKSGSPRCSSPPKPPATAAPARRKRNPSSEKSSASSTFAGLERRSSPANPRWTRDFLRTGPRGRGSAARSQHNRDSMKCRSQEGLTSRTRGVF